MLHKIKILFQLEYQLEGRTQSFFNTIFTYILGLLFIIYLSFDRIESASLWNSLLWILILFTSTYTLSSSFDRFKLHQKTYWYTLVAPEVLILFKLIYNSLVGLISNSLLLILYILLLGAPILQWTSFISVFILGSIALAVVNTFVNALTLDVKQSQRIGAVILLPLLLPVLVTIIKGSYLSCVGGASTTMWLIILSGLTAIVSILSYLLFPIIWKS